MEAKALRSDVVAEHAHHRGDLREDRAGHHAVPPLVERVVEKAEPVLVETDDPTGREGAEKREVVRLGEGLEAHHDVEATPPRRRRPARGYDPPEGGPTLARRKEGDVGDVRMRPPVPLVRRRRAHRDGDLRVHPREGVDEKRVDHRVAELLVQMQEEDAPHL